MIVHRISCVSVHQAGVVHVEGTIMKGVRLEFDMMNDLVYKMYDYL